MPWHSSNADPWTAGLTKQGRDVFNAFDKDNARRMNVSARRTVLAHNLGSQLDTAHRTATWTRDEAAALRRVFDMFDADGSGFLTHEPDGSGTLLRALRLLGLRMNQEHMPDLGPVDLGGFRRLCTSLRHADKSAQMRPASGGSPAHLQAAGRPLLSGDDGGVVVSHANNEGSCTGDGMGRGFMRTTPIDLEVQHVHRCLVGRAMRLRTTPESVVHECVTYS